MLFSSSLVRLIILWVDGGGILVFFFFVGCYGVVDFDGVAIVIEIGLRVNYLGYFGLVSVHAGCVSCTPFFVDVIWYLYEVGVCRVSVVRFNFVGWDFLEVVG